MPLQGVGRELNRFPFGHDVQDMVPHQFQVCGVVEVAVDLICGSEFSHDTEIEVAVASPKVPPVTVRLQAAGTLRHGCEFRFEFRYLIIGYTVAEAKHGDMSD
nr:hypothetical protein [Saccharopolyspora spinosa]